MGAQRKRAHLRKDIPVGTNEEEGEGVQGGHLIPHGGGLSSLVNQVHFVLLPLCELLLLPQCLCGLCLGLLPPAPWSSSLSLIIGCFPSLGTAACRFSACYFTFLAPTTVVPFGFWFSSLMFNSFSHRMNSGLPRWPHPTQESIAAAPPGGAKMYVQTKMYMCTCMWCTQTRTLTHGCAHTRMHTLLHVCSHIHAHNALTHICSHMRVHARIHTHTIIYPGLSMLLAHTTVSYCSVLSPFVEQSVYHK